MGQLGVDEYKAIVSGFASGVAVITAAHQGETAGMTVSSFTSVSLEPLLVLVSLRPAKRTAKLVEASGRYGVNFLGADDRDLSDHFAYGPDLDQFDAIDLRPTPQEPPVLAGGIGYFVCTLEAQYPGGDHTLYLGHPIAGEWFEGEPLTYWRGDYR